MAINIEASRPVTGSTLLKSPDIQFALGMVGIIMTMIMPLHPVVLDFLLSMSITFAFLVLLVAIYVHEPLDFSTFPTLLLVTTLFRLGLNVASTRSILLDAPSGEVSSVISSFGNFVVGGNYFVGFVIFTILVIVNFIVITKGAGRVAEVGARFTLDAMPGKQMAIDAELNSGLIEKEEAKRRRQKIEMEADFYGAMDGASKFVRGDAIAGIIITAINIVVGLILGVVTYEMSFRESAEVFTLLTVGDGLVSQIPALIISTAAGIVVTRAGDSKGLTESLSNQLLQYPKALFICSFLLFGIGFIPGLPLIPFLILGSIFIIFGRNSIRDKAEKGKQEVLEQESPISDGSAESLEGLLHVDMISLEVGVGLVPLVDANQDGEVLERIVSSRKQFAMEMGIIVPRVMVRDNIQLKPGEYQILLKGNPIGRGNLMVDYLLAMDPGDIIDPIEGIAGQEPAYGLEATWIKVAHKEEAIFRGYTVVNCSTIIVTHLTKLVEEHAHELLGRQETQNLIDSLRDEYPKVIDEVVGPERLNLGDVVKILQNLLEERVSIRDLLSIFETLADYCRELKNTDVLTRYVRIGLGRGIIRRYWNEASSLKVVSLDRSLEDIISSGIKNLEDGSTSLQLEPGLAQQILNAIAESLGEFQNSGAQPLILCGSVIRWEVKQLLKRFIPGIVVLAFDEIPTGTQIETLTVINI